MFTVHVHGPPPITAWWTFGICNFFSKWVWWAVGAENHSPSRWPPTLGLPRAFPPSSKCPCVFTCAHALPCHQRFHKAVVPPHLCAPSTCTFLFLLPALGAAECVGRAWSQELLQHKDWISLALHVPRASTPSVSGMNESTLAHSDHHRGLWLHTRINCDGRGSGNWCT